MNSLFHIFSLSLRVYFPFCTVPKELNGACRQAVCSFLHLFVLPSWNVWLSTTNKRSNLEVPVCKHMHVDLHFQGQRFESNTCCKSQVHMWNQHEIRSSLYHGHCISMTEDTNPTIWKGVISRGGLIRQGVLAYSLLFKRHASHWILAYGIRRSMWVSVMCVCVFAHMCVCSTICMPH